MKSVFVIVMFLMGTLSIGFAETIYLNNGTVVTGKILEKSSYFVTIQSGSGFPKKYYSEQILRIETDEVQNIEPPSGKDLTVLPSKISLITKLLEVNGTRKNIQKNFDQILEKVPADRKVEIAKLLNTQEIIEKLIPIYDNYFTETDINQMILFYQGSLGQKIIDASPKISQEAMAITANYFKEKLNVNK